MGRWMLSPFTSHCSVWHHVIWVHLFAFLVCSSGKGACFYRSRAVEERNAPFPSWVRFAILLPFANSPWSVWLYWPLWFKPVEPACCLERKSDGQIVPELNRLLMPLLLDDLPSCHPGGFGDGLLLRYLWRHASLALVSWLLAFVPWRQADSRGQGCEESDGWQMGRPKIQKSVPFSCNHEGIQGLWLFLN